MSRQIALLLIAAPLALGACTTESGPRHVEPNAFSWNGSIAAGQTLYLRNITGDVRVVASDSPIVRVQASKSWRGRGNGNVRFVRHDVAEGVIVCTLVGNARDCAPSSYSSNGPGGSHTTGLRDLLGRGRTASVDYTVHLPAGVRINVVTISGAIGMADVTGPVKAKTMNGRVQIAARAGPVTASSVNGSVSVAIDSLSDMGDIALSTVNGSVTAQLPSSLHAQLSMETITGSLHSDFDVTGADTSAHKEIRGVIGGGGRRVALETVNGNVKLLRGS